MSRRDLEIVKEIDGFIKKWCKPNFVGHLLDTDENDGERLRMKGE